jgi:hypothetical protein
VAVQLLLVVPAAILLAWPELITASDGDTMTLLRAVAGLVLSFAR